jgi:hypothetical protein
MKLRAATIAGFLALLVSSCAYGPPVNNPQAAIAIADKACADSWGTYSIEQGGEWRVDPNRWHTRLEGDHWKVWTDSEDSPGLLVYVPTDGHRLDPDTSCDLRFQD